MCPRCSTIYPGETTHCPADGSPLAGSAGPLARHLPEPGTKLQNYRLLEVLGEGSMGRIYLAENEAIGRVVALKMLHPALLHDGAATAHFINEARTVNQIRHPNIIEITDFVTHPEGDCFLVMERLAGHTLEQLLDQAAPLSPARTVHIGEQICGALAAAHQAGVVHRDLKPGNVFLLERDGQADFVKLIDFGVAKVLGSANAKLQGAARGVPDLRYLIGTPAYMSPEQITGASIDHKSDIYAVGVLLYEMVSGRLPFGGDSLQDLFEAHCHIAPEPPSTHLDPLDPLPPQLEQLVLRCLAKSPADRPRTMAEVTHRLQEINQELGDEAYAPLAGGDASWDGLLDPDDPRFDQLSANHGLDDEPARLPLRWPLALTIALLVGAGFASYAMLFQPTRSTDGPAKAAGPAASKRAAADDPGEPSAAAPSPTAMDPIPSASARLTVAAEQTTRSAAAASHERTVTRPASAPAPSPAERPPTIPAAPEPPAPAATAQQAPASPDTSAVAASHPLSGSPPTDPSAPLPPATQPVREATAANNALPGAPIPYTVRAAPAASQPQQPRGDGKMRLPGWAAPAHPADQKLPGWAAPAGSGGADGRKRELRKPSWAK